MVVFNFYESYERADGFGRRGCGGNDETKIGYLRGEPIFVAASPR